MNGLGQWRVREARAYLVRDPLGNYLVALCPDCGRIVPLPPHHRHLDHVIVPRHRCDPKRRLARKGVGRVPVPDAVRRAALDGAA